VLRYWPYATYKKTFFLDKYIYAKKNQWSYSFFFWAGSISTHVAGLNPAGLAGSLAQTSDPARQTNKRHTQVSSRVHAWLLLKWIIIHLNSTKQQIWMHAKRWRERTWRRERRDDGDVEGLLANRSVLPSVSALSPLFSVGVRLLSFTSASSSLSLLVLAPLFSPVLQILFAKNGAETERQSLLVLAFDNLKKP
jgi:hypothetical protein